ncbi:hypothetical protein EI94DRAFT_1706060 [Lactarius quietus]|nr:hypothetical protein EI94DRAFT_1706060 [Lactarius quietus]
MSLKGMPGPGAIGPPANLRATSSTTKASAQASVSPQVVTQEKKKAKAKETKELEVEACKILLGKKCLNEDTTITHQSLLCTTTLIIQKYSATAPQSLTRALMAVTALWNEANNSTLQTILVMEILTQKLGERIEKSIQGEMEKMSTMIRSSLDEQQNTPESMESLLDVVTTIKKMALDISKTINETAATTTQITDIVHTYTQALLHAAPQTKQP